MNADAVVPASVGLFGVASGSQSASIEAVFAWHTLVDNPTGRLPTHWWDGVVDPLLPALRAVAPGTALGRPVAHVLSNSFAFGGSNVALLFSRP